jgi:non-heme chloroperoxidase
MVPGLFATELETVVPALCSFIRECHAAPLADRDLHQMLGFNCVVPSEVRAALFSRQLVNDDVLAALRIPTLVVHGAADTVVVPAAAARLKAQMPTAKVTLIDRAGHCVFREAPDQFDRELLDFIRSTQA